MLRWFSTTTAPCFAINHDWQFGGNEAPSLFLGRGPLHQCAGTIRHHPVFTRGRLEIRLVVVPFRPEFKDAIPVSQTLPRLRGTSPHPALRRRLALCRFQTSGPVLTVYP